MEKGLAPPLTLNVSSSNGAAIASGSGRTPAFRVVNPAPGVMKLTVTVRGANGGIAEKSYDTYVSAKPQPVQKPLWAEEVPTVVVNPAGSQSDRGVYYVGLYAAGAGNGNLYDWSCHIQSGDYFAPGGTTITGHIVRIRETAGPMSKSEARNYCRRYTNKILEYP